MEAVLGVTGVDKIWLEENTDDKDSTEDPRTFPRTLQDRRARQESADASTRSAQDSHNGRAAERFLVAFFSGPRYSRTGTRGIPRALRCLRGFRLAARGKSRHAKPSRTWAGVILDLYQRGTVQMPLMITVRLKEYLRPSEMFNLQGGDTGTSAGNHVTLQSVVFCPKYVSSAPKLTQATAACSWTLRG